MAVSELPGNPNAVWTVRRHVEGRWRSRKSPWGDDDMLWGPSAGFWGGLLSEEVGRVQHGGCVLSLKLDSNRNTCLCVEAPLGLSRFPLTKKQLPPALAVLRLHNSSRPFHGFLLCHQQAAALLCAGARSLFSRGVDNCRNQLFARQQDVNYGTKQINRWQYLYFITSLLGCL